MTTSRDLRALQDAAWKGSLPLEIRLDPSDCRIFDQADPYLIHVPRFAYLPFLLPRLHAFFVDELIDPEVFPHSGWLSFEGVPLKWHHPVGLLYDLFSGASPAHAPENGQKSREPASLDDSQSQLPWKVVLHFTDWPDDQLVRLDVDGVVLHDAFINSVKEADFLRNGTAKAIMSMSKDDSTKLWKAVEDHDMVAFNSVQQKLLPHGNSLRHIPLRVYLPASPSASQPSSGYLKVVQSLVTPSVPNSREPQTLGMALHTLLPTLFPSRRTPILAKPVLHGAVVPMAAPLEELLRSVAYLDGWLHFAIEMLG